MFALSCALLSCGNEKNGDIPQLPSPKVIQDEAKTTKTSVAAFWTEVAGAASYNVIFDDQDVVSTTEKEMAWDNLETNSTHTLKVQAVSADKRMRSRILNGVLLSSPPQRTRNSTRLSP